MFEKVSIVIPAKNEVENIVEVVSRCKKYSGDIVVIDGHSIDGTDRIAQEMGASVVIDKGLGKGEAIRNSYKYVKGEIVVFVDADLSHDPDEIPALIKPILDNQADHVTGTRLIGGSSELHGSFQEFLRLSGSSFITYLINSRFRVRISDSQNGFRAIRTEVLQKLDLRENLTTIEQEMIIKTIGRGFRLAEVPTHEYSRAHGDSKIDLFRVSHKYVWSFLKHLYFTRYEGPFHQVVVDDKYNILTSKD